jgi:diguanylate cyclase (GGDEF)-like protein/PAS domain S-box-containing protein
VRVVTPAANATAGEFQSLVEQIPAVTYIADFVGSFQLRYVSPQCKAILGFEPEEWVTDPDAWVRALHPEDRDRIVAEAEACIAAERPFDFEYRMCRADGRVVHLWEKTSFVRDDAGRPVAVNGVMLDVTELKLAQEALRCQEAEREQERARYEGELKRQLAEKLYQAAHDELTGLPNRRSLNTRLAGALEEGEPTALLLLDLDRFKEVNDVLGHHYGDQLLCAVSSRFRGLIRPDDLLARIGGDEFAVLLQPLHGIEQAIAVAERFGRSLAEPFSISGTPLYVESSIGIALYPDHGTSAVELLQRADAAMYGAKGARSGWQLYQSSNPQSPRRISRLAELRTALDTGQLLLHYQPKLDLRTSEVTGFEALVRWQHPQHGLVMPDEFIPLIEQTGLVRHLTAFVLAEALQQWREWNRGDELTIAVNISPHSLNDPDFPELVEVMLREYEVPPRTLELEVTESALAFDEELSSEMLHRLRRAGVKVVLDDYGSGYSSLGRLLDLPIDEIKIDRKFVGALTDDPDSAEIVRSTIALGHRLGMTVIAEGVESEEALRELASLECDGAQGYYISRPKPASELVSMVTV